MPFADAFTRAYNAEAARLQSAQQHEAGLQLSREQMEQGKKIAEARLKQDQIELNIRKLLAERERLHAITTTDASGKPVQKFLPESQVAGQEFPIPAQAAEPVDISGLLPLIQSLDPKAAVGLPSQMNPKALPVLSSVLGQLGANKRDATTAPRAPEKIETVGPDGQPVTMFVTPEVGKSYPKPKAVAPIKPPTEGERRAFGFYMRGKDAENALAAVEENIAKRGILGQGRLTLAPNWAQGSEGQIYNQAQRQFTEARLRKDSGAAIPAHEYENDRRTYFVQPGDTQQVIARKKLARTVLLAALQKESGRAYEETFGTPETSGELKVDGYVVRPKK